MLTFVGLGLFDEKDISLKGLDAIKNADRVYAEFYTSCLIGTSIEKMERLYSTRIHLLSREDIENNPEWLESAMHEDIVFLTGGDTMVSTTHVDLRIRAHDMGIDTKLIHGASISSAACGLSGLQNYRFGKAATVPYPYISSRGKEVISHTPYDTIRANTIAGLHTMVFLDIDVEKGFMKIPDALEVLLQVEKSRNEGVMKNRLVIGIARAGSEIPAVKCDFAEKLLDFDFGHPLHILLVPASLHFVEAEALVKLAGAPEEILESIEK
ncbi:diphthine synthase [Methanosalsum zhilinae DSM 4017]|uniref:Diphthine synthase n=1 Tax=Methanosalsum zhilinae (strain DSM 4017 / NBRC 107636 / OCM 62 / WeN5) TaxID=679901 RepID=F7XKM6_METZD|nr:diphthine synthase [Methanosalsum zhilinae]AEH60629.1 diphthine synthase [Methanosalsum zhilinae DSM 4017]